MGLLLSADAAAATGSGLVMIIYKIGRAHV